MTAFLLFLINPLLGFLRSLKDLNKPFHGIVFILFYALYGYAISFNLTSADSYRIAARFCQTQFLFSDVWQMYSEGKLTDVYLIFIYSIVKIFTNNPKVLFGCLGGIMGLLSYFSIKTLYKVWPDQRNKFFYFLVFFYFLSISFFNVNGIRFWTATSYFSIFAIRYVFLRKRLAIIPLLFTPLIHYGYMVGVLGVIVFSLMDLIKLDSIVYYGLMALMFAFSMINPDAGDIIGLEGDVETISTNAAINRKAQYYVKPYQEDYSDSNDVVEDRSLYRRANSLFTKTFDYVNKIGMFLLLSIFLVKRKNIIRTKEQKVLFDFVLFSFALGYGATFIIYSGTRFIRLANMLFAFWMMCVFVKNQSKLLKRSIYLMFFINFYAIAFLLFNAPRLVEPLFWFAPPILTVINGIGFSPIDFI